MEERDRLGAVESGELPGDFVPSSGSERHEATLFGMTASELRPWGLALLAFGFILFVSGFLLFVLSPKPDIFVVGFDETTRQMDELMARSVIVTFLGFALIAAGGFMFRFGMVRPVTGYVASEAAPAIASVTESIGRGLASFGGIPVRIEGEQRPVTVIRVKCRNCGYLESEDATYCSKCGKPV